MRRDGFLDGGELASKLVRCREPLEEDGDGDDMLVLARYLGTARPWVAYTLLTFQMRLWAVWKYKYSLSTTDRIDRSNFTSSIQARKGGVVHDDLRKPKALSRE